LDQVGRYQILEELGRGAHGVVYKALDPTIGRTIAIKAIELGTINVADRERVREGILREANLAGTLSHPNIVTVYDVLDSGDSAYIFMEFADGNSLEDALVAVQQKQPSKLKRAEFLSILRQVAQALDYAHRKGVIHRDVKPANIVLTTHEGELQAKIADFGVAKIASPEVTQQLGGRAALIGTPSYMSPEQVQGVVVSGASDQFSLAVIAYEVLCGQKPFAADNVQTLLYRIRHDREQGAHLVNTMMSTTVPRCCIGRWRRSPRNGLEPAASSRERWNSHWAILLSGNRVLLERTPTEQLSLWWSMTRRNRRKRSHGARRWR
jgi:serine/threonine protein kinase